MPTRDNTSPNLWVVRAGRGGSYASEFQQLGLVAVGFSAIGDATGKNRDALFKVASEVLGNKAGSVAGQLNRFVNGIRVGDIVVVPDGEHRELLYGRVTGDYEHRSTAAVPGTDWRHVRRVRWLGRRSRDAIPDRAASSLGRLMAVYQPAHQQLLARCLLTGDGEPESTEP